MAELTIDVAGVPAATLRVGNMAAMGPRLNIALRRAGVMLEATIKEELSGPSHSQPSRAPRSRRTKIATRPPGKASGPKKTKVSTSPTRTRVDFAPGNPFPGVVSGTLRRSITHKVTEAREGPSLRVGPRGFAAKYARVHELGSNRVKRRPFMIPALRKHIGEIRSLILKAVKGKE